MQALSRFPLNAMYAASMSANANLGRPTDRQRTAFGERIAAAREIAGISQRELADRLGITQRALSWWEREPVALRPEQIAALAAALGVSADFLLGLREPKARTSGPAGKARRVFETVSKLPRHQQDKIVDIIETLLAGHHAKSGKAA
jgi:transcriptional regulator with XRE-family HTH domain